MNHWRSKYEHEALARIEELEATKIKLQVRSLQWFMLFLYKDFQKVLISC